MHEYIKPKTVIFISQNTSCPCVQKVFDRSICASSLHNKMTKSFNILKHSPSVLHCLYLLGEYMREREEIERANPRI